MQNLLKKPILQKILLVVLLSGIATVIYVNAATNIGSNISTNGTLSVTGTTTLSSVLNVNDINIALSGSSDIGIDITGTAGTGINTILPVNVGEGTGGSEMLRVATTWGQTYADVINIQQDSANVGDIIDLTWVPAGANGINIPSIENTGVGLKISGSTGIGIQSTRPIKISSDISGFEVANIADTKNVFINSQYLSITDYDYPVGYYTDISAQPGQADAFYIERAAPNTDQDRLFKIIGYYGNSGLTSAYRYELRMHPAYIENYNQTDGQIFLGVSNGSNAGLYINHRDGALSKGMDLGLWIAPQNTGSYTLAKFDLNSANHTGINITGSTGIGIQSTRPINITGSGNLFIDSVEINSLPYDVLTSNKRKIHNVNFYSPTDYINLPSDAVAGDEFIFVNVIDDTFTIDAGVGGIIHHGNTYSQTWSVPDARQGETYKLRYVGSLNWVVTEAFDQQHAYNSYINQNVTTEGSPSFSSQLLLKNIQTASQGTGNGFYFYGENDNKEMGSISSLWTNTDDNTSTYLSFRTRDNGAVDEKIRITGNGNVGIGTSTPSSLLHIANSSATSTVTIGDEVTGGSGSCLKLRDSDDGGWTYCSVLDGSIFCSTTSCE